MMTFSAKSLRATLLVPLLALGGCISLGAEPPASLLTLTPTVSVSSGETTGVTRENAIAILAPEVPAKLDVTRVPVQVSDTQIAYLQEAFWVEKPARLFRNLLGETIRSNGGTLVIDSDDTPLVANRTLRGTLREFGYDARTSSVIVQFDAIRSTASRDSDAPEPTVETRRFEAVESGILAETGDVGPALNRAANTVAGEIAEWLAE